MKRLIISWQESCWYLNKCFLKNVIKQIHNGIKQHEIPNLNWRINFIWCNVYTNQLQDLATYGGEGDPVEVRKREDSDRKCMSQSLPIAFFFPHTLPSFWSSNH